MGKEVDGGKVEKSLRVLKKQQKLLERTLDDSPPDLPPEERKKLSYLSCDIFGKLEESLRSGGKGWERYKNRLFQAEKAAVPLIAENASISKELACGTLVSSCALDAELPVLCAMILKPRTIYLFCPPENINTEVAVEGEISASLREVEIFRMSFDADDPHGSYAELGKIVYGRARKYGNIVFDVTPSCQPLVSYLSIFSLVHGIPAVFMRCDYLEMDGKRLASPFSQRLCKFENPVEYYGDTGMAMIESLFNSHLYEAALKDCQELGKSVRDLATAKLLELLERLISIYRDWDLFHHSMFFNDKDHKEILKAIGKSGNSWLKAAEGKHGLSVEPLSVRLEKAVREFKKFGIEKYLPENWEDNLDFLEEMDGSWKNSKNLADEYRLVDVYVNALRRGSEKQGKYDDAVARLYRCVEMCATIKLREAGLGEPDKPDYGNFAKENGLKIDDIRKLFTSKGKELPPLLALDDQMALLGLLEDGELVRIYERMKSGGSAIDSVMYRRNYSILAHGTLPLSENDWVTFRDNVKAAIIATIGKERFDRLYRGALHGKLRIT